MTLHFFYFIVSLLGYDIIFFFFIYFILYTLTSLSACYGMTLPFFLFYYFFILWPDRPQSTSGVTFNPFVILLGCDITLLACGIGK